MSHRAEIIKWFAQGYTVRTIALKVAMLTGISATDQDLLRLGVCYAEDIEKVRREIAEIALVRGLARKEERVARLNELAERWEDKAKEDGKAARTYMATLKQIQSEMEPLGIRVHLDEEDPWAKLLKELSTS